VSHNMLCKPATFLSSERRIHSEGGRPMNPMNGHREDGTSAPPRTTAAAPDVSIVVPVYNEDSTLPELRRRLQTVMGQMDAHVEIVFVNDGSRDTSLVQMRSIHQDDRRFGYVSLARNFGHQVAVTAGIHFAGGKAVIVMDGDLQDPPELIPELIRQWRRGFDVVHARRARREDESRLKRGTAYVFYRMLRWLSDVDIPSDAGDFCLMDRRVVDLLKRMPERNRYVRGLRAWVGFRQTTVSFDRPPRSSGKAKYTFRKSLALAIDGIVSFSMVPLRIATYLGLTAASLALMMSAMVLFWRLRHPEAPLTGFAIILIVVFFLGSVQLVCMGLLGEYVGRIYEEVKQRPLFTVDEVAGVANVAPNAGELSRNSA